MLPFPGRQRVRMSALDKIAVCGRDEAFGLTAALVVNYFQHIQGGLSEFSLSGVEMGQIETALMIKFSTITTIDNRFELARQLLKSQKAVDVENLRAT
jgi:hypothetical protein